jgi:hypothetical protein
LSFVVNLLSKLRACHWLRFEKLESLIFRSPEPQELLKREPHLPPPGVDAKEELAGEVRADALNLDGPNKAGLGELRRPWQRRDPWYLAKR